MSTSKNSLEKIEVFGSVELGDGSVELDLISDIKELPRAMQLTDLDIDGLSVASFLCYGVENKIPLEFLSGRTGYEIPEIQSIVHEAKQAGLYNDLITSLQRR